MKLLDIAEVARRTGLPASALRYYEAKGLIHSVGRRGLRRLFEPTVIHRISLVKLGRTAGFTLDEIAEMFTADGRLKINRVKLISRADQLQQTIRELTALRNSLVHAAHCPAPSHLECPSFQRLLRVAGASHTRGTKPRSGPR
jgi:DNA-binding transcriptional MerR regulator